MSPLPKGAEPMPAKGAFRLDPPPASTEYKPPAPGKGVALGTFGPSTTRSRAVTATHGVVVNLDYQAEQTLHLLATKRLELFDPATAKWSPAKGKQVELRLPPGGGRLVRLRGS
jgi:hypothetical protein